MKPSRNSGFFGAALREGRNLRDPEPVDSALQKLQWGRPPRRAESQLFPPPADPPKSFNGAALREGRNHEGPQEDPG